ncbi:hypothetical protein BC628DRAFT_111914 [Trametes gibbosa]|nr:hypothetical protein BC628DRAFT_612296 [Trametes gibbosa]KAI0828327.1 hypothetical protein BC628DRAFT_111914 [Trametes gibbosa]
MPVRVLLNHSCRALAQSPRPRLLCTAPPHTRAPHTLLSPLSIGLARLDLIVIVVHNPAFLYRPSSTYSSPPYQTRLPLAPRLIGIFLPARPNHSSPIDRKPFFPSEYNPLGRSCCIVLRPCRFGFTRPSHASYGFAGATLHPIRTHPLDRGRFLACFASEARTIPHWDTELMSEPRTRAVRNHTRIPAVSTRHMQAIVSVCHCYQYHTPEACCALDPHARHSCSLGSCSIKPDSLHRGSCTDLIPISCAGYVYTDHTSIAICQNTLRYLQGTRAIRARDDAGITLGTLHLYGSVRAIHHLQTLLFSPLMAHTSDGAHTRPRAALAGCPLPPETR